MSFIKFFSAKHSVEKYKLVNDREFEGIFQLLLLVFAKLYEYIFMLSGLYL